MLEAVVWRCSIRTVFLKISQNSHGNNCGRASFPIKLQEDACKFIKEEALAQMLSWELFGIFKNIFFYRTPPDDCF